MAPDAPQPTAVGLLAIAAAVLIWAGWVVAVRASLATLGPLDLALLRYGGPALLLAPVWLRRGVLAPGVARWRLAAMCLGWGAPFVLLAAQGLKTAEIGLFAALVPGAMPLWVALIAAAAFGARFGPTARLGLALIALAAAVALWAAGPEGRAAAPWLAAASIAWAVYTVAYRGSGLSPVEATALVAFWSTAALAPAALVWGEGLSALSPGALATQFALHGVVSGVVSVAAYAQAVRTLGPARAAGFAALVPGLAALGGAVVLGEVPDAATGLAVAAACVGVALLNRATPAPARPPAR